MVKTTFELNASLKNYHEKRWKKIELDCMHALLGAPHRHAHAKGCLAEETPRRSGGGAKGERSGGSSGKRTECYYHGNQYSTSVCLGLIENGQ